MKVTAINFEILAAKIELKQLCLVPSRCPFDWSNIAIEDFIRGSAALVLSLLPYSIVRSDISWWWCSLSCCVIVILTLILKWNPSTDVFYRDGMRTCIIRARSANNIHLCLKTFKQFLDDQPKLYTPSYVATTSRLQN